ncbi:MAG: hypothetical protein H7Y60_13010 [Rhodospirillaceae bacterium]|nr:hypothetical protein [Rhodospirillales bacterium]
MTQQNAALVEESAAAAHALEDQSRELNRLMGFFHTGAQPAQAVPVVQKAAPRPAAKPAAKAIKTAPRPKATAASADKDWAEF